MELWDAYDRNFNKIEGVILERGPVPNGMYHLVCDVAVKHVDGTYLLMQRDSCKHYGGMWELTAGGSAFVGETPLECAKRELVEETGIKCDDLQELVMVISDEHSSIYFEFLCITDCEKSSVTLQEGETMAYRWVSLDELRQMNEKELVTQRMQQYLEELL